MLKDDALHFIRLGGLLERGDNTARILDMQYHILRQNDDEGASDFYRWGALLRSLSAFQVYRKVYRDAITPGRVADLLILREDLPRSLHACADGIVRMLQLIANNASAETARRPACCMPACISRASKMYWPGTARVSDRFHGSHLRTWRRHQPRLPDTGLSRRDRLRCVPPGRGPANPSRPSGPGPRQPGRDVLGLTARPTCDVIPPSVGLVARTAPWLNDLLVHRRCEPQSYRCPARDIMPACVLGRGTWAINSVVECHLHTVEVSGSNPLSPTISQRIRLTCAPSCPSFSSIPS
jgi:hypothetical protein